MANARDRLKAERESINAAKKSGAKDRLTAERNRIEDAKREATYGAIRATGTANRIDANSGFDRNMESNAGLNRKAAAANRTANRVDARSEFDSGVGQRQIRGGSFGGGVPRASLRPGLTNERVTGTAGKSRLDNVVTGAGIDYGGSYISAMGAVMQGAAQNAPKWYAGMMLPTMEEAGPLPEMAVSDADRFVQHQLAKAGTQARSEGRRLSSAGQQRADIAKSGMGAAGQFAVDAAYAGTQMVMDIGVGWLTGLGMEIPMAVRSFGAGAEKARADGASLEEQLRYGTATAAMAYATSRLSNVAFSGLKAMGVVKSGVGDDVTKAVIDKLVKKLTTTAKGATALKAIATLAASFGGEFAEEYLEAFADPFVQRLTYNEKAVTAFDDPSLLADYLYEGLIGGVLGLVGGGTNVSVQTFMNTNADENMKKAYREYEKYFSDEVAKKAAETVAEGTQEAAQEAAGAAQADGREKTRQTEQTAQSGPETGGSGSYGVIEYLLEMKRVPNSFANEIIGSKELSEAFFNRTGIKLEGTAEQKRNAIRETVTAWQARQAENDAAAQQAALEAEADEENRVRLAAERTREAVNEQRSELERQAVKESGYRSYVRGMFMRDAGISQEDAVEIANDPAMRAEWEAVTGKKLPEDNRSAVKMIRNTKRDPQKIDVPKIEAAKLPDLSAYPALQKAMETGTVDDPAAVVAEAVNAVNNGVLQYGDIGKIGGKTENNNAAPARAGAAEQKAPGYYGNVDDADAAYLDRLAKAAGVSIERAPVSEAGNREGWIIGGRVYMSDGREDVVRLVAKHEVTHYLQEMAPEAYKTFRDYVESIFRGEGSLEDQIEVVTERYRRNGEELTAEEALDEVVSNYAGELLDNEALIRKLAGENRNIGQRILDGIRDILRRLRTALGDEEVKQLDRAARLWEQALKETNRAYYQEGKRAGEGEARSSVKGARELQKMIDSGVLKTYEQITDAQNGLYQQERDLAERKRAAVNSPELTKAMGEYSGMFDEMRQLLPKRRNGTATQAELDRIEEIKAMREEKMEEIVNLQERLGLKEIEEEEAAIRETKERLRVAADEAWEREGAEKEDAAIAKAGMSSAEYFRKKALKAFKTTTNFNEAGYLLPDGKMLNFSGGERNHRYRDHREIGEIYEATNGVKALNRFIADGNIRVMAESPGIDLAAGVEPTYEQYAALKKFINSNGKKEGQFFVDFSGKDGRREGNYSYTSGVNADKIINDIKYYYETGKIREQSAVSMFHERSSVKGARELQQQARRKARQEQRLQEMRKAQSKIAYYPRPARNTVKDLAAEICKTYESKMDKGELTDLLDRLYGAMAARSGKSKVGYNVMDWAEIRAEAQAIANQIIADSRGNINPLAEEYADLRKEIRGTRIAVSPFYRGDFDSVGGYEAFRKRNMGTLKLGSEGEDIGTFYESLSEKNADMFPIDIVHPADQLIRISDVMEELKAVEGNPFENEMEEAAEYLAGEIQERFYELPSEVESVEAQLSRKYEKQRRKEREANSLRLRKMRKQSRKDIEAVERRFREENQRRIENQSETERRNTIAKHAERLGKKLLRPTDKQHIPDDMRGVALAFVTYLDLESGYEMAYGKDGRYHRVKAGAVLGAEPTSRTAAARELQAAYKQLAEDDSSFTIDPDMDDYLDEIAKMGEKKVADMSRAELDTVWKVMQVIEHTISKADEMLAESRYKKLSAMAEALRKENGGKKDRTNWAGPVGVADRLINTEMLSPETYFSRLGEAGKDIFRQMRKAADRQTMILKEGTDRAGRLIEESGVSFKKADGEIHSFELEDGKLDLSTSQLMELYALSKRKAALEHIYIGGLKPVDATVKGKILGGSKAVKVTPLEVATMLEELTPEQKKLVDGLQNYLSGDLAKHGNEESRKVYGYSKFLEQNYWPIKVSRTVVASDPTKAAGAKTIPGYGMTKTLKPHAKNAVELRSAIDTFSSHLNQMATYAAWLGTNENITKLHNFKFQSESTMPDGTVVKKDEGTVKELLEKVYGKNGNGYLENLLADIAQGTKAGAEKSIMESGLSKFKAAKVGANLRVIFQQPTAILRAMEMVNPKYFASGKTTAGKGWEKAVKYSPIAQWKDWGYFELDTGRSLRELMTGTAKMLDKVKNAAMYPAGWADSVSWGYLWNAVEAETADRHPEMTKGSREFYEAVAERFGEVVDRTQVVDTVLHRSQIMRSSNYLDKVSTSFMSEPTKVYNMVVRDLYELIGAEGDTARKKAGKQLARTSAALVTSFAVNALAQSLVDGLRDDDREKGWLEKSADKWLGNFADNFNVVGYIPVAKDVLSLVQGYTLERSEMEGFADLINAANQVGKALSGESQKTVLAAGLDAAARLGDAIGLPVSNLKRDAEAIVRTVMIGAGASEALYRWDKMRYSPEKAMGKFYDDMYRAMDTDQDTYELIYDDVLTMLREQAMEKAEAEGGSMTEMEAEEKAAAEIKSAMESRMKKALGLEKTSSLPVRYSAPGEDEEFDRIMEEAMENDGDWAEAFGGEVVEMARELDALDDATKTQRVAQIGEMPFTVDVREDALENVLSDKEWSRYQTAKAGGVKLIDWCDFYESVKDERILRTGKAGTESQEDVESVLGRMKLTDAQKTAIWNGYGWKKESPWS